MGKQKKLEVKIIEDALKFFCIENKENIVACDWYDTKYCLRKCKFYIEKQQEIEKTIKQHKYWTR